MKVYTLFLLIAILSNSFSCFSQETIKMESMNGVFLMPCTVNGLSLKFYFDTGASDVSISLTEAIFMLKNGYLLEEDIIGTEYYQFANGNIEEGTKIVIREIRIGRFTLNNIKASVNHNLDAPLLLGQSALSQLGKIQIDYNQNTITIYSDTDLVNDTTTNQTDNVASSVLTAYYAGISFNYSSKWTIEKEELESNLSYQINCINSEPNSPEIFSIIVLNLIKDTEKLLKITIKNFRKNEIYRKAYVGDFNNLIYKGCEAVTVNFNLSLFDESIYGMLICYNTSDKTILILKQTDSINKLVNGFKLIEDSLIVD